MLDDGMVKEELGHNFHEVYDEVPTGIAYCNAEGVVLDCNPAYLDTLNVTRNEIIGYNIFDHYNFTDEVMETIKTSDSYQYEVLYKLPSDVFENSDTTLSLEVKIVRHLKDDEILGYMIYLTNHTHQWNSYEERYQNLIDNLPLDYTHSKLIFDEKGQIADYLNMSGNKQCNEFYIKHNMTWGKTLATKFLPDTYPAIIGELNKIRNSGAVGGQFFYNASEVGEIYEMAAVFEGSEWVNLISLPVTTIEHARKIAEQNLEKEQEEHMKDLEKSMKEVEAANAAKTNFLFNMSHDIRTPMNAIIGFTDILENNQEDPKKRQNCINKIKNASSTLLELINNVLDMSWIDSGKTKVDEKACSVPRLYEDVASVFDIQMLEKDISFTLDVSIQHAYAYLDETLMKKVLINLISNAYKYTNAGGKVNVLVKELPCLVEDHVTYQTIVQDNGIGMSKEFQKHLFEEFSRERTTTESKVEGSGLGMAVVKKCVDLLDGTIEVDSEQDKGSTFKVTMTHRKANQSDIKQPIVQEERISFDGKKILLAEDNDINSEIACEVLQQAGFEVVRVENGQECIEKLEACPAHTFDVILMDVQMPIMNGYDATKEIRKLTDKEKASIPILALTANAFEEDKQAALKAGMNGHIAKPIDINKLMNEIGNVVNQKMNI